MLLCVADELLVYGGQRLVDWGLLRFPKFSRTGWAQGPQVQKSYQHHNHYLVIQFTNNTFSNGLALRQLLGCHHSGEVKGRAEAILG